MPDLTRGEAFAATVRSGYDLGPDELELLEEVRRCLDLLDDLQDVVRSEGSTTAGSAGQTVIHPAVVEGRQMRVVLLRLLGSLGLALADDEAGRPMPTPASLRARNASNARWARAATNRHRDGA